VPLRNCSLTYSKTGCDCMGMCCENKTMIGWRNVWSMKWRVPGQEKTWREIVEKDCQARKLNREDVMDRNRWMKQIGTTVDHDSCEWWLFLLVLAYPACPRQNAESRKMVVCVCVCVCVCGAYNGCCICVVGVTETSAWGEAWSSSKSFGAGGVLLCSVTKLEILCNMHRPVLVDVFLPD